MVTCSGIATDGSLRIVRNGIGMVGQATIELSGIRGLWSLRAEYEHLHDSFLVLTFVGETRLLAMNEEEELEEAEPEGFDADNQVYLALMVELLSEVISSPSMSALTMCNR